MTVLDLVRLLRHLDAKEVLSTNLGYFADLNEDGFVTSADADLLANAVLDLVPLPEFPLTRVRETSPQDGESDVAITRETILRFTHPLAADIFVTTNTVSAQAVGRRLLSRVEVSSDRRALTLFYLENLPGSAVVAVTFDSDGLTDFLGRPVDGGGYGFGGGQMKFSFTTAEVSSVSDTAVIGRVLASTPLVGSSTNSIEHPLEGVRVSVDGMEETLFATTDVEGNFSLEPAPAGRFFVHIDGRTSRESQWPAGPYYPVVGKAWEAIAGVKTNLAGGTGLIYLPLIAAGTLQAVSPTADTSVTFPPSVLAQSPGLAGVSVTVPANSLYSDNGTRGGKVGIAPVAPDRLPSPLPEGLNFPVVITVQTDGPSNFDQPASARFPNLPDPVTGKLLPPGAKSALWSFNHDAGEWELQGQMTVTADGRFVETDPGVGIRQPGWHGSVPGARGKGGKIKAPKPKKPCQNNGEPCDDGDPCTTNDRCQGGVCIGDLPDDVCPGLDPITPIHFQWSETINVGKLSYTLPTDFSYTYIVCYDPACHGRRLHVASMDIEGIVNLSNYGSTEPNPVDGGNVTSANYCEILSTLANYLGNGRGKWHLLEATRVHEHYHRDVELPNRLWPFWQLAEATMESFCIPCTVPQAQAERALATYADAVFETMQANFWAAQIPLNKKHNDTLDDAAYQAGQKVLDAMAVRVRDFGAKQGFGTCPTVPAAPRPLHLVGIEATVRTNVLDVGGAVQIEVTGTYSDGSTRDLTAGSTGTAYSATDRQKVTLGDDGLVHGVKPGPVTVIISHPPDGALDGDPLLATVSLTIRSPDDMDNDGMPDAWERIYGLNPNDPSDAKQDRDGDGLNNLREFMLGTDPNNLDTDEDGIPDGAEILDGSNPLVAETLADSALQTGLHYFALLNLTTGQVEQRGKTDSNGQAFHNLILAANADYRVLLFQAKSLLVSSADFSSPDPGLTVDLPALVLRPDMSADTDQDGLSDLAEFIVGSDPQLADSDGDGIPDGRHFLPDQYPITIGDVVGNGSPAPGAGILERPRSKDYYTFTAFPGQMVYLALVTNNVPCCVDWQMEDDEGNLVFFASLQDGNVGRLSLDKGGLYTLTVGDGGTNQTGSYQFKFWDVVPEQFAIHVGDAVTNGVPAVGSGNIETPGALDVYTFTAHADQQVYFDFKEPSPSSLLEWELEDADGYLNSGCVRCLNPGVVTLKKGGAYKLTMGSGLQFSFEATPPETGPYAFKIWDVPPPQQFAVAIGDVVSDGVPGLGAGVIETPGVQDIYTFSADPGQQVFFHVADSFDFVSNLIFLGWALRDQDGQRVFGMDFGGGDPGVYTLARGGTYTLTVDDLQFFTTGAYGFQTWNVPPPSSFAIHLGDTVQEDQPGPGAGKIESPGAKDIYTFTAPAGASVSFKVKDVNPPVAFVRWSAVDEAGTVIFDSCLGCSDPGTFTLSQGGIYTVTIGSDRDAWVGTYQFQIKQEP